MTGIKKHINVIIPGLLLLVQGCVEPFEIEGETYESALVVEGTITNEEKNQEIKLSTTHKLEDTGPLPLRDADVRVLDDTGEIQNFLERDPGIYISVNPFKAEQDRSYKLEFSTSDGRNYSSDPTLFSGAAIIEDIYAEYGTNIEGDPGIEIRINSRGTSGSSGYYRYEYGETYKIVSPFFKTQDIVLDANGNVALVPKSKEEYTCYKTDQSQNIVISNTNTLNQDNVQGELLRFIRSDNPVFGHRYSILVKQFGISREAYSFYKTLKDMSESESLFSQIQPGYIAGNIYSLSDPDENVLGFFSVSSVTEKRVYFDRSEFYDVSQTPRPTFTPFCPRDFAGNFNTLVQWINNNSYRFFDDLLPGPPSNSPGRYIFVSAECVDCTLIGSNVVPDFWEE